MPLSLKCDNALHIDNALPYEQEAQGKSYGQYLDDRQIVHLWRITRASDNTISGLRCHFIQ